MGLPEILAKVIYETIKIFQCDGICHYFKAAYQGTILGIRFYYKRFYKERRGCKNPSTEIQYWWMSHALVTPRD